MVIPWIPGAVARDRNSTDKPRIVSKLVKGISSKLTRTWGFSKGVPEGLFPRFKEQVSGWWGANIADCDPHPIMSRLDVLDSGRARHQPEGAVVVSRWAMEPPGSWSAQEVA